MIYKITAFLQANLSWIGIKPTDRVLDYACGPGTLTAALGAHAAQCQGIDLSDKMVEAYNTRFKSETRFKASAMVGDLLAEGSSVPENLSDPKLFSFDLAAVGLGFHHIDNLELCVERLKARLRPGGTLLVVDFVEHEPENEYHKDVAHHGFSEARMKQLFAQAGLVDVDVLVMEGEVLMFEPRFPRKVFAARGRRRPEE
ncbi:hypothetical protein DV735_g2014, partial [Chaetothyriales sp. CBS 134920]